jgi:hypothetical protein
MLKKGQGMTEENKEKGDSLYGKASNIHHTKTFFFLGAASGLAFAFLAPLFSKQVRPWARRIIKNGMKIGQHIQKSAAGMKEELEDIAAEAKAEIEREREQ